MTSDKNADLFYDELTEYMDFNADLDLISSAQKYDNQTYHVYLSDIKKEFSTLNPDHRSVIIKELSEPQAAIYQKLTTVWNPYLETIYGILEKDGHCLSISEFIEAPQALNYKNRSINLEEYIADFGCFSETDALILLYQLCDGVEALQKINLTHGDISPQNILLTDAPAWESLFSPLPSATANISAKIIDFDISKEKKDYHHNVTSIVGTELFAAPEILDFRYPSDKIDIYSLGCILHYMLTGESPKNFDLESSKKLMHSGTFRIIKGCTSSYEVRYKHMRKLKREILRQLDYPSNTFLAILAHIPGFRSHKFWKMAIATYFYAAWIICIALSIYIREIPPDVFPTFAIFLAEVIFVLDIPHLGDLSPKYTYLKNRFPILRYIVKFITGFCIFILLSFILYQ